MCINFPTLNKIYKTLVKVHFLLQLNRPFVCPGPQVRQDFVFEDNYCAEAIDLGEGFSSPVRQNNPFFAYDLSPRATRSRSFQGKSETHTLVSHLFLGCCIFHKIVTSLDLILVSRVVGRYSKIETRKEQKMEMIQEQVLHIFGKQMYQMAGQIMRILRRREWLWYRLLLITSLIFSFVFMI